MKRAQSENRRGARSFRQREELRNDGTLKFDNRHMARKPIYGSPEHKGTNKNRKKKKNMKKVKFLTKNRHKR